MDDGRANKRVWEKSVRNLDVLEALQNASVDAAGINEPCHTVGHPNHSQSVCCQSIV